MILVHETSFNILIHFLSEKRLEIKQNMILYIPVSHGMRKTSVTSL